MTSSAAKRRAKALYADRTIPLAEIARRLGVGTRCIQSWRKAGNWPKRRGGSGSRRIPEPEAAPRPARSDAPKAGQTLRPLAAELEPVIRREIERLKSIEVEGLGPEQRVRLIRSLVQCLNSLRPARVRPAAGEGAKREADDAGDRKSLAELRDELYRHCLRIRHERAGS